MQPEVLADVKRAAQYRSTILHVMVCDKFIPPFIDFVERHFPDFGRHLFFIFRDSSQFPVRRRSNTRFQSDFAGLPAAAFALTREMHRADRIILHGLFIQRMVQLLALQPWVLGKCYWVIWGGDLYGPRDAPRNLAWHGRECMRRFVISRLGHLATYTRGDYDLARKWYGARGQHHKCLNYPSNLYCDVPVAQRSDGVVNIQIGNSADPSNEHFEMLRSLARHRNRDIRIYAPLSYPDPNHAAEVAQEGAKLFGDKFVPLCEFMPFDQYLRFLGTVDIAIFNHRRQQAMGNIITLLGLGRKVYLRADVTSRKELDDLGIRVFDSAEVDLEPIDPAVASRNREIVKRNYSESALVAQLREIFE